jgi:predicted amidohydrolase YtcJ
MPPSAADPTDDPPALALVNARVWTGDRRRPWADAILMIDGCIAALGSSAEIAKRMPVGTQVVDARRRLVARRPAPGATHDTLHPGEPANVIMVQDIPPPVTTAAIAAADIVMLIADGRIVHDRDGLAR